MYEKNWIKIIGDKMGMFDYVNFEINCPVCSSKVTGFQSKDKNCDLLCLEFWQVDNFYSSCDKCGAWIEFNIKEEVRKRFTINDYEMNIRKK